MYTIRNFYNITTTVHSAMSRLRFSILLLLTVLVSKIEAQTPGLTTRQPIGAYLNNAFPTTSPGSGGAFTLEDAFPGVTFVDPIKMVQQPGTSFVWVICRQGQVWRLDKNSPATTKTLMLDLASNTLGFGDSGLLGIALHPEFGQPGSANRGFIYVWYNFVPDNTPSSNSHLSFDRLSRFTVQDGATSISRSSESVMINQYDEHEWHNGGDMFFGPDSFLYIGVGDEGDLGEPYNNAQKINNGLFSGMLRIDVNQNPALSHAVRRQPLAGATITAVPSGWPATYTQGYFIPNDNPWVNPSGTVLEEFYAIGLRNPYRMSYDASSGKTLIGDVGQEAAEEIDVLEKGANYQWSYLEGTVAGPKSKPAVILGKETSPIYSYSHAGSGRCIIGGYVYRGSKLPGNLAGKYIYGDFVTGQIWSLDWQTPGAQPVQIYQMPASSLTGFSVDANNETYVTTLGASGQVLKLSVSGGTAQPPATLSATGAFTSLSNLTPTTGIVPYNVNSPLWSDGATKQRWVALPNDGAPYTSSEVAKFSATGIWSFPVGTVFIKHFELGTNDANPAIRKRLETRFLVNGSNGWYGVTYKWRADGTDADLLTNGENLSVTIANSGGGTRTQNWTFPSRGDCMNCHTPAAGFVLGPKTRQLNGNFTYPSSGINSNQLATWSAIGMFDVTLSSAQIASYSKTVPLTDTSASLELKVRSYLDSNCAHCHQPGGVRANMDARFDTPLNQTNIVNGPLFNDLGVADARIVAPKDITRSMMHIRANSLSGIKMPPLAKNVVDTAAVTALAQWINSLSTSGGPQPNLAGTDVGFVIPAGSTTGSGASGSYTVNGSGSGIYDVADSFQYAWTTLVGDGEIRARVNSQTNTNEWAKAGVMVRETLDEGSRHAVCFLTPENGFGYEYRASTDQPSEFFYGPSSAAAPNNWVKMVRSGDTLRGYASADGQNWTLINSGTVPGLQTTVRIGLIVTSSNNGTLSTTTFDNVQITGGASLVNQAPSVTQPADQVTVRGAVASLQIQASDPEANALTYSASGLPTGLSINVSTGLISGTVSTSAASNNSVTVSASDGSLSNSKTFIWTTNAPGAAPTLTGADIGTVTLAGSTTLNSATGIYTVKSSGSGIAGSSDAFQFTSTALAGDCEIRARVTSLTNTNSWSKAGVMIREDISAGARFGLVCVTPSNGFAGNYRTTAGGLREYAEGPALNTAPNNWVRIVRAGNTITGYTSANGTTWTQMFNTTLPNLASVVRYGLAVTSTDNSQLAAATFDNVLTIGGTSPVNQAPIVTQPADQSTPRGAVASLQIQAIDPDNNSLTYSASGLPAGLSINVSTGLISGTVSTNASASNSVTVSASDGSLSDSKTIIWATNTPGTAPTLTGADIGSVSFAGSTALNSATGVYTVKSSGSGIFGTADEFQFASTALTGDGEIKARVTGLVNSNSWSKAGVMIREDMTEGARFGMVCVTPGNGLVGNYRTTAGGLRNFAGGPALNAAPNNWVRIVRSGSLITGYTSFTGTTWTHLFSTTLPNLASTVRFGLAVTATDNSQLVSATFDNVQVTTVAQASQSPAITLVALDGAKVQLSGYPASWSQWQSTYGSSSPNTGLLNYALGQDPRSVMGMSGLRLVKAQDGHYGVQFKHRADISDVTYRIETSTDLTRWNPLNASPVSVDGSDGTRTDTYSVLDALLGNADATVFIRLRVNHTTSGLSATGYPLSLQRVSFAAGSQTLGYANVKTPIFAGRFADMPLITIPNCYLEVCDGPYVGHRFDIGSDGRANAASFRNTSSALPNLAVAQVVVRPHVTLDDALDKTKLISGASPSVSDKASFYVGSAYVSYWLYNATPADPSKAIWIKADDTSLSNAGGRIIAPGEGMFLKSSRNTSMILGGHLRMNSFVQVLRPGQSLLAQPFPLAGSPALSGFNSTNGLIASSQNTSADQLLIWNGDTTGGKSAFNTIWYAQLATSAHWVSANDATLADQSNAPLFQPNRAVFLKRTSSTTTTVVIPVRWNISP